VFLSERSGTKNEGVDCIRRKTAPSYAKSPPNSTAENFLRQNAHPGDRTTKGTVRGGNDSGQVAERIMPAGRCGGIGHREVGPTTPPAGHRAVPRRSGVAGATPPEKTGSILFTESYIVKKNIRRRPFHRAKNPLQSDLTTVYNPPTIHEVCVLYTASGGSRYRVVSRRTEPPGSSSSTNSCDILPPGGSVVKFGSKLSFPGSPPSLALAPAGALSAHIKTQSSIQDLWYNDPIQDTTNVRRAGRIGRRRPERIRSAFRKSRLHQITTNGKEGCGAGGTR